MTCYREFQLKTMDEERAGCKGRRRTPVVAGRLALLPPRALPEARIQILCWICLRRSLSRRRRRTLTHGMRPPLPKRLRALTTHLWFRRPSIRPTTRSRRMQLLRRQPRALALAVREAVGRRSERQREAEPEPRPHRQQLWPLAIAAARSTSCHTATRSACRLGARRFSGALERVAAPRWANGAVRLARRRPRRTRSRWALSGCSSQNHLERPPTHLSVVARSRSSAAARCRAGSPARRPICSQVAVSTSSSRTPTQSSVLMLTRSPFLALALRRRRLLRIRANFWTTTRRGSSIWTIWWPELPQVRYNTAYHCRSSCRLLCFSVSNSFAGFQFPEFTS